jgi:hypothetical protein
MLEPILWRNAMKCSCALAAAAVLLLCTGCLDSKEGFIHFSFDVDYALPQQTLPGDPLASLLPPQPLPDIPIDMNADSEFNSRTFDHIVGIELKELTFAISASSANPAYDPKEPATPTPDDWSFLESIEIWIENPVTHEQAPIAYVPAGSPQLEPGNTTLSFVCVGTDITDYFDGSYSTTLIIKTVGTFPPDDVMFGASARFRITAALIR